MSLDVDVRLARDAFELRVSLTAERGQHIAVMGPSGAGKSTLLAALAGFTGIDDGRIELDGRMLSVPGRRAAPRERGVVLLGQDARLFPHLTAGQNVAFALRTHGTARAAARAESEAWLERVGLAGFAARRPAELSGGQQQRVALARALAAKPRVVLLDEPFTSLDPETAADLRELVAARLAHSTQTTAVVVTHDAVDALALGERLVVIEAGQVVQQGEVREVLAAPSTAFVAAIAGLNRVPGVVRAGAFGSGALSVPVPGHPAGDAVAVFPPAAVRSGMPESGEAGWRAAITRFEQTLGGVRVHTGAPAVAVDMPFEDAARLHVGDELTLALEVARVRILPGSHSLASGG